MSTAQDDSREELVNRQLFAWAARYRETSSPGPILLATLFVVALGALDHLVPAGLLPELRKMLFQSGWVPYGIMWWGAFGFFYLCQIWIFRFVPLNVAAALEKDVLEAASRYGLHSQELFDVLMKHVFQRQTGYFSERFMRLFRQYHSNPDLSAVERLRDDILENDEYMSHLGFSAVRCAEWAMPLLGFLGTVIGIGQAIGSLKSGMQWDAEGMFSVNSQLVQESFAGMALAFETTLEGLVGLLIVGTVHAFLRKKIDEALARAQPYFIKTIENTETVPAPVHITEAGQLEEEIRLLRSRQRQIETMIETVIDQDPQFQSIKEIIFKPVFEFEAVFEAPSKAITEYVQSKVKSGMWQFGAASAAPDGSLNAVLVDMQGKSSVCCFGDKNLEPKAYVTLSKRFDRIVACNEDTTIARAADNGELFLVDISSGSATSLNRHHKNGDWLQPILSNGSVGSILHVTGDFARRRVEIVPLGSNGNGRSWSVPTGPSDAWALTSLAPDGTSALFGSDGSATKTTSCSLLHVPISDGKSDKKRAANQPDPLPELVTDGATLIQLPNVASLRHVAWIGKNEVLLIDQDGQVWLFDLQRDSPTKLVHDRWKTARNTLVMTGHNRWFARHANKSLSMWKLWPTGSLHDYPKVTIEVDILEPSHVGTSRAGRLLWCAMPQRIAFWQFPEYQTDLD